MTSQDEIQQVRKVAMFANPKLRLVCTKEYSVCNTCVKDSEKNSNKFNEMSAMNAC